MCNDQFETQDELQASLDSSATKELIKTEDDATKLPEEIPG